jgi:hypothetical protein
MNRIVFLLGSGISIDAGKPSVDNITAQVLSGAGAFLQSSKVFAFDAEHPNFDLYRPPVEPVRGLVEDLRRASYEYFERAPNYEEIATVARAVGDTLSREYESPAVMPFVQQLVNRPYAEGSTDRLQELCQQSCHYIADTVHHMLGGKAGRLDHLGVVVQACRRMSGVTLASLNHDLVLEEALEDAGVCYADGFEEADKTVDTHFWIDNWEGSSVSLLKLHGSLDWWAYKREDEQWRRWAAARYKGNDPWAPTRAGVTPGPSEYRPLLLIGTYDKILAYETWIFPDQHVRFLQALRMTKRVVMIGYGLGDKAINSRLIGWLDRARDNKLVVCHPDPSDLFRGARPAIREKQPAWEAEGRLVVVANIVADLTLEAIADCL